MRARPRPDDRVAEAAQRRLEALVAEISGHPVPSREEAVGASRLPPPRVRVRGAGDGEPREDQAAEDQPAEDGPAEDQAAEDGPGEDQVGEDQVAEDQAAEDQADLKYGTDAPEAAQPGRRHARQPLPRSQRAVLWAGDRVPAVGLVIGARHMVVVTLVLLVGLVLAGWSYLGATGGPEPGGEVIAPRASGGVAIGSSLPIGDEPSSEAEPEAESGAGAGPAPTATPASTSASASVAAEVVVDVEGKVRRPGIAVLPVGSRVVDALEAAGGTRSGADLRGLNLARVLVDGEQLLVGVDPVAGVTAGHLATPAPVAPPDGGSSSGSPPVALVDLNTADQTMLETLPGVGPVTAAAILEWRTEHGAFTSVDELLEVSGIGEATLAEIAPHVTL